MAYTQARDAQLPLRMSQEMKSRLQQEAKAAGRSVNAEVIYRLAKTFDGEFDLAASQEPAPTTLEAMAADIAILRRLAESYLPNMRY
ncbi:Arc family DNA-binding protein [Comamonas sp.]|uniref:Arc family DNA-binding protein n=1 Tax=Comamonas sp. TaxID=34028 RepID=UPI0028A9BC28|nr:Arc family DNA-binding protein [Comamonas sp.]